jgi:hypothetical protein
MSKYKAKPTIVPWLSGKADNQERRFIQVGNHLLLSKRFQQLGAGAKHLYFCMAMESGGRRSFLFPQTAALKYGIAPSSLRRYIRELEAGQFLKVYSTCVSPTDMNLTWDGSRYPPLRLAPPPWLHIVDLARIGTRKVRRKSHWLYQTGTVRTSLLAGPYARLAQTAYEPFYQIDIAK